MVESGATSVIVNRAYGEICVPSAPINASSETIGDKIRAIFPEGSFSSWGKWPPNVFAVAASIMSTSGGYASIVNEWHDRTTWPALAERTGRAWVAAVEKGERPPKRVRDAWAIVHKVTSKPLMESRVSKNLRTALLELIVFADEASAGVGIPHATNDDTPLLLIQSAYNILLDNTLTPAIPTSKLRVLPKQHTPTVGVTLRSLTHHLALLESSEVEVKWHWIPGRPNRRTLNLLVVPWPYQVATKDFSARKVARGCAAEFDYEPHEDDPAALVKELKRLLETAKTAGQRVDGIILPESSMSPESFSAAANVAKSVKAFLMGGVRGRLQKSKKPVNVAVMRFFNEATQEMVEIRQRKHHRWKLTGEQVNNYKLQSRLSPARDWWESTVVSKRAVNFVCLSTDFVLCCLICEDLARQDPIADVVRIVGPNLVIALLFDGPQIKHRWPGRYATILSDDPGSSVLSLTSSGMAKRSTPPKGAPRLSSIALWQDGQSEHTEITLPKEKSAALLRLAIKAAAEQTLDGRSDGGVASYPYVKNVTYL